jgi:hypothetical protein
VIYWNRSKTPFVAYEYRKIYLYLMKKIIFYLSFWSASVIRYRPTNVRFKRSAYYEKFKDSGFAAPGGGHKTAVMKSAAILIEVLLLLNYNQW